MDVTILGRGRPAPPVRSHVAHGRRAAQAQVRRARILLACDTRPEAGDKQIASGVGCSPETVRKWRKRWAEARSIKDAPRTGRPRAFSP